MKMIKRSLCLALSLIMVIGMFPIQALATDEGLEVPVQPVEAAVPQPELVPEAASLPEIPVIETPVVESVPAEVPVTGPALPETPVTEAPAEEIPAQELVVPEIPVVDVTSVPVKLWFTCTPAELSLYVYDMYGVPVAADADGGYSLMPGDYVYCAYCEGYLPAEMVYFSVPAHIGSMSVQVALAPVETIRSEVPGADVDLSPEAETETVESLIVTAPVSFTAVAGSFNGSAAEVDENGNLLINEANFPDAAFREFVSAVYDTANTGVLSAAQVAEIREINVAGNGIASLKGVEYFPALTELVCSYNNLTALDLSANTALVNLDCSSNRLSTLELSANTALSLLVCSYNNLSTLDVSANTGLTTLDCSYNNLSALDVSANTGLATLHCAYNRMRTLDVSKLTGLGELYCEGNRLAVLDLSLNSALVSVHCYDQRTTLSGYWEGDKLLYNMSELVGSDLDAVVDISAPYDPATGIVTLCAGGNSDILASVSYTLDITAGNGLVANLSANAAVAVPESDNLVLINETSFPDAAFRSYVTERLGGKFSVTRGQMADITEIDCSGLGIASLKGIEYFTGLTSLDCSDNSISALDLSKNTALTQLVCSNNKLSLLDLSHYSALTRLEVAGQTISADAYWAGDRLSYDLGSLVGAENKALVSGVSGAVYDKDSGIVTLDILPGDIAQSAAFKYQLSIGGGNAWVRSMEVTVSLNVPEYSGEKLLINEENFPDAAFRAFVTELLDKSGAGYLTASQLEGVTEIDCSNKGIASLKGIERFTALRSLVCSGNDLSALDVSANTALTILDCSDNSITALDLSKNPALKTLECSDNALTALELSANTALESLICSRNALSALDVSGCKALSSLHCDENDLSQLVLGSNTSLRTLWCANNELTELELGGCPGLTVLYCGYNRITELDLSALTALNVLNCEQNGLGGLDLSANTALSSLACGNQESTRNAYWSGDDLCFDLSALVGKSNISKISNVSSDRYNASTGVVTLQTAQDTDYVSQFGYTYTVSGDNTMEVTIHVLRPDKPAGGSAGENIDWVFDPATGIIKVSGSGEMEDFAAGSAPWDEYKDKISSIVVDSGVTSIADNAFSGFSSVSSLTLPAGLTTIGDGAFSDMSALESISIPATVTGIGSGAFSGCSALEEIKLNSTTAPSCDWNSTEGVNATISFPASNSSWLAAMEKTNGGEDAAFTWRIAGSSSYSEHIKLLVETYSDSAACVIGISENVKLDTGITVPGKVSLIVSQGVSLELKGQLNVKGSASINGSLSASNLTVNGSLETAPGSSITVTDFATYGPVSLNGCTVDTSTLKIYDGSVIDLTGGAKLNVINPDGVTNPRSILINVDGAAYTAPGQAVSENVFGHINYAGAQPATDAELAALLAADVAKMDITIVSDLKLTADTAIGAAVSLSVSGGSLSTGSYALTNKGSVRLAANLNVNEGGSFTNNGSIAFSGGNVILSQGASVSQGSGSCGFDEGFGAKIEEIDMLIKLGLRELKLTNAQYELAEDLTLPSTVSVELDNVQLTIPEGLRLVRNGSSIVLKNGSILTVNGAYDGPEIALYEGCQALPEEKISYTRQEGDITYVSIGIPVAEAISITDSQGTLLSDGEVHTVDMSEGTNCQLNIVVEPENASSRVTWKSSAPAVATVSETGLVTFLKLGEVSFTATTVDAGKKTATATLDVVFAGIDVKTKFTAAIAAESCGFAEPQPLNIGLQKGDSVRMYIYGTDKTQPLPASLFAYEPANTASAKLVEIDENTGIITAIKDGGTASVKASFRDDPLKRSVTVSVKTIPVQAGRIKVIPDLASPNVVGIDGNGHICSIDGAVSYAIFVDKIAKGTPTSDLPTFTVSLDVTGTDGEKMPIVKGKHTWASTGSSLATVKENADGTATITLKANVDGACTITATAKDTTKAQGSIAVYIVDYAPRLEAASVTLDSQMLGTATLGMVESYEAAITEIAYLDVYDSKTKTYSSSGAISVAPSYGEYEDNSGHVVTLADGISLKANKFLKNQTIRGQLSGTMMIDGVSGSEVRSFSIPLNVVIKNSVPSVTIKQLTRINSFYTDSYADFTATVKNVDVSQIEDMRFVSDTSKGAAASFASDPYVAGSGVLTVRLVDSVSKLNTKGTLYIKLYGYNSEIEKAVTVSAVATKPSLVLEPASLTVNAAAIKDENLLSVRLSEKSGRVLELSEGETWFIGAVPEGMSLIASGDTLSLRADRATLEAYKGGRVQIGVQDDGWTGSVTVNLSITKSSAAATLKLAKTTLNLNSAYFATTDQTRLMFSYANMNIAELDVEVAAAKPNAETEKLDVSYENGIISARIKEGSSPKAGSYSYTLKAKQGETEYKAINFTVRVTNTPPAAKLSKTSLSLSSSYVTQTDSFTVSPVTAGHTLFSINEVSSKATAANMAEYEKIGFNVNGNVLEAYVKDQFKSNPPKAGTYSYSLMGELNTADGLADFKPLNFTVKVLSTAPTAKLTKTSVTLNNVFTDYSESVQVLPTKAEHQLIFGSLYTVGKATGSMAAEAEKIDFVFDFANGSIIVKVKDEYKANPPKAGTYSFTVNGALSTDGTTLGEGYFKPLNLSVRVVNTKPKVTLSATTLNLNTTENLVGMEKGMISLVAPAGYEVVSAKVERTDTNATTLGHSQKIQITETVTDGKIFASLNENDLPKAGSYRFKVTPRVQAVGSMAESVELPAINFTVKVYANAKYSATVSASGKLDAALRSNFITYTLTKLTNISGEVMGVALSGQDADKFNVELGELNAKGQPTVKLSLKDGVGYATNVTYKVQLDFALRTNYAERLVVSTNALSVKVSSTALRLTGEPKLNNIYQSQSRSRIVYYTVKLTSPADARIGSIVPGVTGLLQQSLVNEYTNVSSVISADGKSATIKVVIKDTSKLSANRTYTLPLLISAEGGATNAATKLNLSLKVFK